MYLIVSLCPEVVFCEWTDGRARQNACQSRNTVIEATVHLAMLSSVLSCVQVETVSAGTQSFCAEVGAILHAVFSVSSTWRVPARPVLKSRLMAQVSEPPRSGLSSETAARTGSMVPAMMRSMPIASLPLVLPHRMLARWRSLSTQSPVTRPTAMPLQVEQLSPFPYRRNKPALTPFTFYFTRQPCLWPLAIGR